LQTYKLANDKHSLQLPCRVASVSTEHCVQPFCEFGGVGLEAPMIAWKHHGLCPEPLGELDGALVGEMAL